jgi:DNA-dependent RNA polymerase auxiliary subunit epsilon
LSKKYRRLKEQNPFRELCRSLYWEEKDGVSNLGKRQIMKDHERYSVASHEEKPLFK